MSLEFIAVEGEELKELDTVPASSDEHCSIGKATIFNGASYISLIFAIKIYFDLKKDANNYSTI